MVCTIAENMPLRSLKTDLNLPLQCHSFRKDCLHGLVAPSSEYALGIPGAAIGYCQALFHPSPSASQHTEKVKALLTEIQAPWANSHELFWGYRADEAIEDYIVGGMSPLIGDGRVPILITGLDPGRDSETIENVLASSPTVPPGETVLLRLALNDRSSLQAAVDLIRKLVDDAFASSQMPRWWPLLQGDLDVKEWLWARKVLGDMWKYTNIAINPFSDDEFFEAMKEQITVAQVVIGHADGVSNDGTIRLAPGMKITGAGECAEYSIYSYLEKISTMEVCPTIIVLGPTLREWSDGDNQRRIASLIPLLRTGCESILWRDLSQSRKDMIWNLDA